MSVAWRLKLGDGLRRLSGGGLMAREWVRALMARIEYCDHRIKAWGAVDRSAALAAADDRCRARGGGVRLASWPERRSGSRI